MNETNSDENSKLKTDLETSATKLSLKLEEIQRLTARTNELNKKFTETSLKNDESILKLATSPDMASTSKDNSRMIKSKPTELKDQLSSKQTILKEKEATLDSTLQAKKLSTIRKSMRSTNQEWNLN